MRVAAVASRTARTIAVAGAAVAVLLATSCSSADDEGATAARAAIATVPEQTTTTNPYAVPPVIDAAYVNRVLAGLDAAVGDVVRFVVNNRPGPREIVEHLKPIYNDTEAALQLESFHQDSANNYEGYRNNPGNQVSSVTELVTGTPNCIFAHVSRDYEPVVKKPNPDLADQWMAIVPLDPARDPSRINPTGWMYIYDGFEIDHVRPKDPCGASS